MWPYRNLLVMAFLLFCTVAYSQQQDITFHLSNELLNGKTILCDNIYLAYCIFQNHAANNDIEWIIVHNNIF